MGDTKQILVVIDPTAQEQPALERAAYLARHTGAALELFICHYDEYISGERFFDSPGLAKAREDAIERRLSRLESMAEPLRAMGLTVFTEAVWDSPLHEGIVRKVLEARPDLVVKDTHYHPAVRRAFFTNTDWNLIRSCPRPLMLVKPGRWPARPRLIGAVDPMHDHDKPASLDHKILDMGERLGQALDGTLHVFHAYTGITGLTTPTAAAPEPVALPVDEIEAHVRQSHARELEALLQSHDVASSRVHMLSGKTGPQLSELVGELEASLVITGAVARTRLQRVFVGSTAEKVLDRLPCDLLVVKPDWFECPVQAAPPVIRVAGPETPPSAAAG